MRQSRRDLVFPGKTVAPMLERLSQYNVVWDSPSKDASGSMPIGNGDLGANVWVEENGDLLLLLSKADAWDENASLLKLGRVRISCTPPLQVGEGQFRQTLHLDTATISIAAGGIAFRIWADICDWLIRVEASGAQPFEMTVQLEV